MLRSIWIRSLGIAMVALIALSIGTRPSIRASQPSAIVSTAAVGVGFAPDDEEDGQPSRVVHLAARPMSVEATKVWLKLQDKLPMQFPNDTPLEDVLKYIRASTIDKASFPDGIPVYVDPRGLQDSDKTLTSTIRIDLKGIPLASTLRLLLDQLALVYRVHDDGLVYITNHSSEDAQINADSLILDNLSDLRREVELLHTELIRSRRGAERPNRPLPPAGAFPGGLGTKGGMM